MTLATVDRTYHNLPESAEQLLAMLNGRSLFTTTEIDTIWKAFRYADKHQERDLRLGGWHIHNTLSLAEILIEYRLDAETISSAILYESIRRGDGQLDVIEEAFGDGVVDLVKGVLELERYSKMRDDATKLQNLMMTIISDVRTIIIHLANRLHLVRHLHTLKDDPERQTAVAQETLDLFAPMAERLGIWEIKSQLEDLSFRYAYPEAYQLIADELHRIQNRHTNIFEQMIERVLQRAEENGMDVSAFQMNGRPKHFYSIHKKLNKPKYRGMGIERIYDKLGVRIIVNTVPECYSILGLIHSEWPPIPGEFDDYIGMPRPSGYQSLHTAVRFGDHKHDVMEFQIRTHEMHQVAEYGVAAHWLYKEQQMGSDTLTKRITWLRQVVEGLQQGEDVEVINEALTKDYLFAFTPDGKIIEMVTGATPVDFAYAIHTEVGHRCRGAIVDGRMVSLDYQLQSGQIVKIVTAKKGGPSRDWLNPTSGYTASKRTRSKIRRWFRTQERDQNILYGKEMVEREIKRLGLSRTYTPDDIALTLGYDDLEEFFAKAGFGDITSGQVSGAIVKMRQKLQPDDELHELLKLDVKHKGLTVKGVSGLHTQMARCCAPVPPEPIIGFITRGRGITVHRQDCTQVQAISEPERLIHVEWGIEAESYAVPIVIEAQDRSGLMGDIANILKVERINLTKAKTHVQDGYATISIVVEITSLDRLSWLLHKFESLPNILSASRQRWA